MSRNPVARWTAQCFCVDKYSPSDWQKLMDEWCTHWEFQLEQCPTTQTEHISCSLSLIKKVRKMPDAFNDTKGNWTPVSGANSKKFVYTYAAKGATRKAGPWSDLKRWEPPSQELIYVKLVKEQGLRPWQQEILESCMKQQDEKTADLRHINVVVDTLGGQGKLVLATWLEHVNAATEIPFSKDIRDIMGYACQFRHRAYFFDLPRALVPDRGASTFWAGVECLKDGRAYDPRYKSRKMRDNPTCVWIFTNSEPKWFAMTTARWRIWRIGYPSLQLVDITEQVHERAEDKREAEDKEAEAKESRKRKRAQRDNE